MSLVSLLSEERGVGGEKRRKGERQELREEGKVGGIERQREGGQRKRRR